MGENMLNKILQLVKRFIFGVLFLYGYNVLVSPIDAVIPINFVNIILVTFLGFPALIALFLFSFFVF